MSGNWFAPEHDGEGFVLEVLNDETAVMYWFTYAPSQGRQLWMLGVGEVDGDSIYFDKVLQPFGARFGDDFDPDDVVLPRWGDVTLRFADCNHAVATYSGPDEFGANFLSVQRLTGHLGLECEGPVSQTPNLLSGSWFDPDRDGEGWTISRINETTAVGLWFTYSPEGEPFWLIGVGEISQDRVMFDEMLELTNGRFGPGFDPDEVTTVPWGSVRIENIGCDSIHTQWTPTQSGFSAGERTLTRLTRIDGLGC